MKENGRKDEGQKTNKNNHYAISPLSLSKGKALDILSNDVERESLEVVLFQNLVKVHPDATRRKRACYQEEKKEDESPQNKQCSILSGRH